MNTIGRYVWPNNFIGETYQEEIDYLENWLYKRLIWMDENIPGKCTSSDVYFADGSNKSSVTTYPNPFTERLTFEFYVDKTSNINLEIYDLPGKRIYNVLLYNMGTGKHIFLWDGTDNNFSSISKGIYLCVIKQNEKIIAQIKTIKL